MHILNKSKRIITSTAVGVSAFAVVAAPGAAFAHGWSSGSDNNRGNAKQASSNNMQDKHGQSSPSNKQNNSNLLPCDQQQQILNQRTANAQARYQKQLTGLNIMLSGIQTYVSSGDVSVDNYDSLNAKATASQAVATDAVNSIKAPVLNCVNNADQTSSNMVKLDEVANGNTGLQSSIKAARQALYGYRQDVNKLFEAVINSTDTAKDINS